MNHSFRYSRALIAMFLSMITSLPTAIQAETQVVDSTLGQKVDDSAVSAKVKAKLLNPDSGVSGLAIDVETYKGEVQLSGFVDNARQAETAERLARSVEGVKSVRNSLNVK